MDTTSTSDAKELATAYFTAIGRRDLDAMEGLFAPGAGGTIHGIVELRVGGNYRDWFGNLFRAFPDFTMEILDVVGEADLAALRWRATGTFTGESRFEGLNPNGAAIDIQGMDLIRTRDGRIFEVNAYVNATELARKLGAMPPAGSLGDRAMLGAVNAVTAVRRAMARRSQA